MSEDYRQLTTQDFKIEYDWLTRKMALQEPFKPLIERLMTENPEACKAFIATLDNTAKTIFKRDKINAFAVDYPEIYREVMEIVVEQAGINEN